MNEAKDQSSNAWPCWKNAKALVTKKQHIHTEIVDFLFFMS